MEDQSNNHALSVFKALRSRAGQDGEIHIDMHEICRAAGLDETEVKECLTDLESEGYISSQIVVQIAEEWR
jgi:DNA-binding IclR family transcriptional regulator